MIHLAYLLSVPSALSTLMSRKTNVAAFQNIFRVSICHHPWDHFSEPLLECSTTRQFQKLNLPNTSFDIIVALQLAWDQPVDVQNKCPCIPYIVLQVYGLFPSPNPHSSDMKCLTYLLRVVHLEDASEGACDCLLHLVHSRAATPSAGLEQQGWPVRQAPLPHHPDDPLVTGILRSHVVIGVDV